MTGTPDENWKMKETKRDVLTGTPDEMKGQDDRETRLRGQNMGSEAEIWGGSEAGIWEAQRPE